MGAKEFFTAIDMLDVYNTIMKQTQQEENSCCELKIATKELGKYRSYVYREKMLKKQILEAAAKRAKAEKLIKENRLQAEFTNSAYYKRSASEFIDLWLRLSQVLAKKRSLERKVSLIPDRFVKKVVLHRYFKGENERLHSWAQTARELELPMTGSQLRTTVTKCLQGSCF